MTGQSCEQMGQMMGAMMGEMMNGMGGGVQMGDGFGGTMMWGGVPWFGLIVLGVILVVGVALALAIMRRPAGDDPREILRRRFAQGELSAEDFAAALKALG